MLKGPRKITKETAQAIQSNELEGEYTRVRLAR